MSGSLRYLGPNQNTTRAQAVALILRTKAVTFPTALPTVTALNPTGQPTTAAGTLVTITGTGFVTGATVAFGGIAATSVNVVNSTTITCYSPAHAVGVVDVTVTTPAGTSLTAGTANDYTYGLPTVTALNPTGQPTAAAGTPVTITGTNFVTGATVAFGTGYAATSVVVVGPTTITCYSPAHAAAVVDVTVTTPAGTSLTAGRGNDYTYALATKFAVTMTGSTTPLSAVAKVAGTPFSVRVTAQDAGGNTVTSYTGTVALTSNAFVGTVNAVITTGGLVDGIVIMPTIAGTNNRTIAASDGTITTANASGVFTVNAGAATKYLITSSSYSPAAGTDVTITAQLADVNGNPVSTAGNVVTWTKSDANGSFATATSTTVAGGVATVLFTTHTVAGTATTVTGTTGSLTGTSANITTIVGAAAKLAITTQPVGGASGAVLTTQPVVRIEDSAGNLVSSTASITVTSSAGSLIGGSEASGLNAAGGVATFTDLTLAGTLATPYTLIFSSTGLTSITSASTTVS